MYARSTHDAARSRTARSLSYTRVLLLIRPMERALTITNTCTGVLSSAAAVSRLGGGRIQSRRREPAAERCASARTIEPSKIRVRNQGADGGDGWKGVEVKGCIS